MLATALAAVLAVAPSPAPKATPTPAPPPVIEGTVRGPSGAPVKNAIVAVRVEGGDVLSRSELPITVHTDQEGRFRITLKKASLAEVDVEATGLAPKNLPRVSPGKRLEITLDKGRVLEGVVRNAASGRPVAGARVEVSGRRRERVVDRPDSFQRATSDASGRFKLEGLGAGPVTVTASRPGYGRTERTGVRAGTRLELLLLPGTSLLGVVRGPDGKGVSGAQVRAESDYAVPPPETTDADGRFELAGAKPGSYRIWAHRAGLGTSLVEEATLESEADARVTLHIDSASTLEGRFVAAGGKPQVGKLTVIELDGVRTNHLSSILYTVSGADGRFHMGDLPAGSHALAAQADGFAPKRVEVTIPAGGTQTVDLGEIELERGLTIRGRVVDKAGSAVAGARIFGWSNNASNAECEATSETDGTFVLAGLELGAYSLNIKAAGYAGQHRDVESGADNVVFTLQPAGTITGQVVDERGSAVEAFRISARLQREEAGVYRWQGPKDVEGSDGRFTIEDVGEGTYRVEASAEGKRPGSVKDVAVKPGAATDAGRIRLEAGGTIKGVVVDTRGAPVAAATVQASGAGLRRAPATEASSGLDGSFEIQGVPFGTVSVFASHPDFATGKSEPITVEPGQGPVTTRIVLSAGGRIEGHIRRRDGSGMTGGVRVYSTGFEPWMFQAVPVSAADGSFVVEHVPVGRAGVEAWLGADEWSTRRWEQALVVEGETATVEFLFRDVLVSGRVTRSGEPLPSVRVQLGFNRPGSGAGPLGPPPPAGPKHGSAITGADGSYELFADQPGREPLTVESMDYRTSFLRRDVEIPDADTFTLDVALTGAPVSGIVVERDTGDPIVGSHVGAYPRKGSEDGGGVVTGSDGRFAVELVPGAYKLSAQAEGYARDSIDLNVDAAGVADVRIALSHGKRIEGRVVNAAGHGVGGVRVTGISGDPNEMATPKGWAMSESDGSFSMESILDGSYELFAGTGLDGFAFAPQIVAGRTDVVLALQPAGHLLVTVKGANGPPVEGAWVTITRVAGHFIWAGPSSTTAPGGTVEMPVPQGPLEVTAKKGDSRVSAGVDVPAEGVASLEVSLPAH